MADDYKIELNLIAENKQSNQVTEYFTSDEIKLKNVVKDIN